MSIEAWNKLHSFRLRTIFWSEVVVKEIFAAAVQISPHRLCWPNHLNMTLCWMQNS